MCKRPLQLKSVPMQPGLTLFTVTGEAARALSPSERRQGFDRLSPNGDGTQGVLSGWGAGAGTGAADGEGAGVGSGALRSTTRRS